MIEIGEFNTLKVIRQAEHGMYLGNIEEETVLIPNRYIPEGLKIDDVITVFVYGDSANRPIATTLIPNVTLNQFGVMKVKSIEDYGAFMDWGIAKDLLVPFSQMYKRFEVGETHVIHLYLDDVSDRLVGSGKISDFLMTEIVTVEVGDEVNCMAYELSDLGMNVIINNRHRGLIYHDGIFKEIKIGDKFKGYVNKIRNNNKIDISLNKFGYRKIEPNADKILDYLEDHNGKMPYNDKSDPETIYNVFGISKKVFKKALGSLYKQRIISIEKDGVKLLQE